MEIRDNSIHFDSIQSFYEATRDNQIQTLVEELKKRIDNPSEVGSWKNSLPDLAKLLYDPEMYYSETKEDCDYYIKELSVVVDLIEDENLAELKERLEDEEGNRNICNTIDRETMNCLMEIIQNPKNCDDEKIDECKTAVANQLKALKNRISFGKRNISPINAKVEIEYELENGSRIDVLLSDPDQNRYVIIELKQWTENNIKECEDEDNNGLADRTIKIKEYEPQSHPALKVREDYRKQLQEELGEDAIIMCLVYLHNQFFENSKLFHVPPELRYDKEFTRKVHYFHGQEGILYTRMRCDKFREKIHKLFTMEIIEDDEE